MVSQPQLSKGGFVVAQKNGPNLDGWLTASEACAKMRKSKRSLDRLVEKGVVRREYRDVPRRSPEPLYNPDDVAAQAEKMGPPLLQARAVGGPPRPIARALQEAIGEPQETITAALSDPRVSRLLDALTAALERLGQPPAPPPPPPPAPPAPKPLPAIWLDLDQAAEYSGISKTTLRKMVKHKILPSIKDGRKPKVRRADLDVADSRALSYLPRRRPRDQMNLPLAAAAG